MRGKHPRRLAALLSLALATAMLLSGCGGEKDITVFQEKAELLRQEALADWVRQELGDAPAGEAGQVVFLSVCDGASRAQVYSASGQTLDEAWDAAVTTAGEALKKSGLTPKWVKADLVYLAGDFTAQELKEALQYSEQGFFYYGAAFDAKFETALLEAELNAASLYDYENGGIDLDALNRYLKQAKREKLQALPESYTLFRTAGWLCGEDRSVHRLSASGLDYGRRLVETVDPETVRPLLRGSADWLAGQQSRSGGIPAQAGGEVDGAVHAQALSALLEAYRLNPDEGLKTAIARGVSYLADQVDYDSQGRAFLPMEKTYTLEGTALAATALAEYGEVFQTEDQLELCRALGEGLVSLLDQESGSFTYALDKKFQPQETQDPDPSADGAAVYALCRLYGLTEEAAYLDAARTAGDRIAADKLGQGDAQTALAVDLLSQYVPDKAAYYVYVLESAQKNLETIYGLDITSPGSLELLMAAYQSYTRMVGYGGSAEGFYLEPLLETISARAQRQLDGCLFPECAMYWETPEQVQGAFMLREQGLALDTAGVCKNVTGYALYCANYENLIADGLTKAEE